MSNNNTHVPDKLEAFMLQVRHALFELICASNESDIISVEAIDDVAVENADGIIAEQIKNTVSSRNPLSNRSTDFWKTLYNWCIYIDKEKLAPSKLKLIVVSNGSLNPGSIPNAFNDASNQTEVENALRFAAKELKRTAHGSQLASDECLKYIDYCLDSKNKNIVTKVICLFSYDIYQTSYDETLTRKFNEQLIPPEYADLLFYTMLGWVNNKTHEFTKNNQPSFISKKEYNDALRKEMRGIDIDNVLQSISTEPDSDSTYQELHRHDIYIQQLELIDIDYENIISAVCDFLRTSSEKIEFANRGLVNNYSFNEFNNVIKRKWSSEKTQIELLCSKETEIMRGQLLYAKCQGFATEIKLQGCNVPSFFCSGTLHILANTPSDAPTIGWHPNYLKLLEDNKDQDND